MNKFAFVDCKTVDEALGQLGDGATVKAGGIDLLDLMKDGIVSPPKLVNIRNVDSLRGITAGRRRPAPRTAIDLERDCRPSGDSAELLPRCPMPPVTQPRRRCATWPRSAATSCSAHAAGISAPATSTARRRAAAAMNVTRMPVRTSTTPS